MAAISYHRYETAQARSRGLLHRLVATDDSTAQLVARVALGAVIFPHGAQKLLGWFGGYGWDGTMGFFTQHIHLPAPLAALLIVTEFFSSIALILGVLGRAAALGVTIMMVGAIATVHAPNGFFMNWTGRQAGEGFEFHLLAVALAFVVMIAGSGKASIDRAIADRV
ncbi:MAG: DoxX family protein [Polyangiales bacterium]